MVSDRDEVRKYEKLAERQVKANKIGLEAREEESESLFIELNNRIREIYGWASKLDDSLTLATEHDKVSRMIERGGGLQTYVIQRPDSSVVRVSLFEPMYPLNDPLKAWVRKFEGSDSNKDTGEILSNIFITGSGHVVGELRTDRNADMIVFRAIREKREN